MAKIKKNNESSDENKISKSDYNKKYYKKTKHITKECKYCEKSVRNYYKHINTQRHDLYKKLYIANNK